ncbi:hypothetical protein ASG39_16565 [Rhizobium sp. Leaf371]|uniref:DUF1902 domain-containing protein n=1 Tax=Rhizobium sp. Leaf371 TaxID=1736355 RepID=UPI000712B6AA|nr:DUF1902 domain-containing protein [Rhizobium sp. Leaf371]KQS63479.1 hypothetical protein ASG39_16565 [Rhizobium sp. Leaf371]
MKSIPILVRAAWDAEASVWVATSRDIDGLAVEAGSMEELETKVLAAVADLVALNGSPSDLPEIPVHIMAEHVAKIPNPFY